MAKSSNTSRTQKLTMSNRTQLQVTSSHAHERHFRCCFAVDTADDYTNDIENCHERRRGIRWQRYMPAKIRHAARQQATTVTYRQAITISTCLTAYIIYSSHKNSTHMLFSDSAIFFFRLSLPPLFFYFAFL